MSFQVTSGHPGSLISRIADGLHPSQGVSPEVRPDDCIFSSCSAGIPFFRSTSGRRRRTESIAASRRKRCDVRTNEPVGLVAREFVEVHVLGQRHAPGVGYPGGFRAGRGFASGTPPDDDFPGRTGPALRSASSSAYDGRFSWRR